MYMLEGLSSVTYFITAYEESQKNLDSHFLICTAFFVSKDNLFDVYCHNVCQRTNEPLSVGVWLRMLCRGVSYLLQVNLLVLLLRAPKV